MSHSCVFNIFETIVRWHRTLPQLVTSWVFTTLSRAADHWRVSDFLVRWKESQRRSPVWESRQLSQKGESPPWQIPDARTAAVRLPSSERDRENTLWPGSTLGRRVPGVSCVLEIEVRGCWLRRTQEIVSVPSYVGLGQIYLDKGSNTSWTLLDNFQIGQWAYRSTNSAARAVSKLPAHRACVLKNYVLI